MNLFDKVKCKGFYKKVHDGKYLFLDEDSLKAYDGADLDCIGNPKEDAEVEGIEKTYYEYVKGNFSGVIVGFKDLVVKCYLDAIYQEAVDVGVGTIQEKFYVDNRACIKADGRVRE